MNDVMVLLMQISPLDRLGHYFESALVRRTVWALPMPVVLVLLAVVVGRAVLKEAKSRRRGR